MTLCAWQVAQQSKQAAAACLAALQLSMLPLAVDLASPPPSSALLNSPNAQIPRWACCSCLLIVMLSHCHIVLLSCCLIVMLSYPGPYSCHSHNMMITIINIKCHHLYQVWAWQAFMASLHTYRRNKQRAGRPGPCFKLKVQCCQWLEAMIVGTEANQSCSGPTAADSRLLF